ncbi:outer dense fiber protein 3-like protein 2 [Anopheles ziemanni]|uniref:outer dense fiber protein 3-like protein 2 n=1 Tax=Anopheles coustani TaxID=139045 RepID=UPI0026586975|nr:outer dense fiber protein 3-like protein 2 [Anopheles coustani]XP_058168959.1 outer dense fiber protein 3-like protein 2 [Anopheles ziemanni]
MPSPGPADYKLPTTIGFQNHDPRKERKPMYTMRGISKPKDDSFGPGPAGYSLGKQTRIGKPHQQMYTMGKRLDLVKQDQTPGPGAHNNHLVPTMKSRRAPQYSFGLRIDLPNKDKIPGPDQYNGVVHMIRPKVPSYSMRPRTKELSDVVGPGPAKYAMPACNVTHHRPPNYSIRGAHKDFLQRTPHPGPANYNLMNLRLDTTAPSYSFGIPYPSCKLPMIVPGDNC